MNEIGFRPIYILIDTGESIKLKEFSAPIYKNGKYLNPIDTYNLMQKYYSDCNNQELFDFFLSFMILLSLEKSTRNLIKRKTTRNTRNIPLKIKKVHFYLKEAMKQLKPNEKIERNFIDKMLKTAFNDLKPKLNIPEKNEYEFSYGITDEVIASTTDEKCKEYLKRKNTAKILWQKDINRIEEELKSRFPEEKDVIKALKKTKSREHLSAISIGSEEDEIYVHIVSASDGQQIKLVSWKLLLLIEHPNVPRNLYDFGNSYKNSKHSFIFNNCKNGEVQGLFNPETSSINVLCFEKNQNDIKDNSQFLVDIDYMLCLYTVLRKLKDDKVRFTKLKEEAETTIADKKIFDDTFKAVT